MNVIFSDLLFTFSDFVMQLWLRIPLIKPDVDSMDDAKSVTLVSKISTLMLSGSYLLLCTTMVYHNHALYMHTLPMVLSSIIYNYGNTNFEACELRKSFFFVLITSMYFFFNCKLSLTTLF